MLVASFDPGVVEGHELAILELEADTASLDPISNEYIGLHKVFTHVGVI